MKHVSLPRVSLEAITYQGRSMLYFDLVAIMDNLRQQPELDQRAIDASGLADVVKRRTKMKVAFVLCAGAAKDTGSFYAEPPLLDAGNPYYKLLSAITDEDSRQSALERFQRAVRLATESVGWVDLKKGTVDGVLAQLQSTVYLSLELIRNRQFSAEELAAQILHELGHIYSFFETLVYSSATNMVVTTAIEVLAGTESKPERIKLVSRALGSFGPINAEAATLISEESEDTNQRLLFLKTFEEGERQRLKQLVDRDDVYNMRSIEFMADQFAIRHGAVVSLANAQHKMSLRNRTGYGTSQSTFLAFQASRYALLGVVGFVSPPIGLVIGLVASVLVAAEVRNEDINPDPIERLARMKGDLVQLLKNTTLSPTLRKQLLQDIEVLDVLRSQVKDNGGLFRYVWRNILPTGRRRAQLRELQKGLEDLINNDLFTQAARLRAEQ